MNKKIDHINLTQSSKIRRGLIDTRFNYEPLLNGHPRELDHSLKFLGKTMRYPIWISSMTGGLEEGKTINQRLALIAKNYSLGMGLGSIRKIMDNGLLFDTYNIRPIIGDEVPLAANLGIAQVEEILLEEKTNQLEDLLLHLDADLLMIHINPLQEWMQKEGDRYYQSPIELIYRLNETIKVPLGLKEVGQGMGPKSIEKLFELPIRVFEFGAFGGTNFTKMELDRREEEGYVDALSELSFVGHDADSMVMMLKNLLQRSSGELNLKEVIISGGISSWKEGMYLVDKLKTDEERVSVVFGQASSFLKYAMESVDALDEYVLGLIQGLDLYRSFLQVRD